ncbi:hypothetical protein LTR36_008381 [Oleoguttula mirabilis]|uniref:Uncharacterized protein n=1 Tax=Oleoguttula mirabilis TaxID=1507867 RepID=A0AAV9J7N3_9PEZI|nr:hypothetical protein LTR36_008381 [Oleoguttula mirabilis]
MSQHASSAFQKRQLWELPDSTTTGYSAYCTPITLPSNGVLSFASGSVITLTTNILFQPQCTGYVTAEGIYSSSGTRDPFYASTTPQTYVIAAATVIAWVLVVMLTVTPRTSFLGGPSTGPAFGNGHGIIGGATGGGTSLIGVGSRPWLQKAAALTVAVSLTIATADTFKVAQQQYQTGFLNATALRDAVMGSLEIRVTRVISDVFLWLAQVQTLIRLFPRHKEKVVIKWIGFALIIFDSTFSCLNSFLIDSTNRPRHFADAIPALSYLFELALGLLYAAWVIYYSVTKRRYAFYHSKMRSICLIALLSLIAILTPVVFFVTDVSNQDVAGWGDYFRWVGAAAASVVVWEWVERIEALERDEKKDGILGREIFDGDEMLGVAPGEEAIWSNGRHGRRHLRRGGDDGGNDDQAAKHTSALEHGFNSVAQRFRRTQQHAQQHFPLGRAHSAMRMTPDPGQAINGGGGRITFGDLPKPGQPSSQDPSVGGPTLPPAVASPISRADTESAASTVYVVRYDTVADVPQPVRRRADRGTSGNTTESHADSQARRQSVQREADKEEADEPQPNRNRKQENKWHSVPNPFKRKRASPPAEVQQARQAAASAQAARAATPVHNFSRWDVKNRLGVLAAETGERIRDRQATNRQDVRDLPVTVIPAQPRGTGRTWSPDVFSQQQSAAQAPAVAGGKRHSDEVRASASTTLTDNSEPESSTSGSRQPAGPSRVTDVSPLGASGRGTPVVVSTPNRSSRPPRADDISPVSGRSGTTVVPAPRRSPLYVSTLARDSADTASSSVRAPTDYG